MYIESELESPIRSGIEKVGYWFSSEAIRTLGRKGVAVSTSQPKAISQSRRDLLRFGISHAATASNPKNNIGESKMPTENLRNRVKGLKFCVKRLFYKKPENYTRAD